MFLKSIDIQGFKSFPDKIHITFGRGITAIVGPNGSGKSNISDAIRWVMGEQSTKTLRGSRMEDIIFSGTAKRTPVGYAEVSLTIDNSDYALTVDYSEVTVTRRFYRSGESEFYINRKPVRLKDIHELLMDTGLGRDGYSMIGQGKIDEILSVRSEERREIFEEAAGITKYRYRKEEAEKRLASSEENLIRINDIMAELEERLEPMKKEAEKEREFLDLRDELKCHEISMWLRRIDALREEFKKTRGILSICEEDLNTAQMALDEIHSKTDGFEEKQADIERRLEDSRTQQERLRTEINRCEAQVRLNRSSLERNESDNRRIEEEIRLFYKRIEEIDEQISEKRTAITLASDRILTIESDLKRCDEQKLENANVLDALDEKSHGIRQQERDNLETVSDLQARISGTDASISEINERMAELETESSERKSRIVKLRERIEETEKELKNAQESVKSARNIHNGYFIRYENRRKSYDAIGEEFNRQTIELADISNRIKLLTELENEYEGFGKAVKVVMRSAARDELTGIEGPVSALIIVPEEYIVAAETALGSSMQSIITADEQAAKRAIEMLKRRDGGRATFLPITSIRPYELKERGLETKTGFIGILSELISCDNKYIDIYRNLLGRTVVIDNMDNAISVAREYSYRFRIVTLDGQLIHSGGSMTGGSLNPSAGILSRKNELKKLAARREKLEDILESTTLKLESVKREAEEARYSMETALDELRELERGESELSATLSLHRDTLHEYEDTENDPAGRRKQLEDRRNELEETKKAKEEELSKRNEKLAMLLEEGKKIEAEIKSLEDKLAALDEQSGEFIKQRETARVESESARASSLELEIRIGSIREDISDRERRYTENKLSSRELEQQIDDLESQKRESEEALGDIEKKTGTILNQKEELSKERAGIDKLLGEYNNAILSLEREKVRLESSVSSLEQEEESISSKLWDSYELTPTSARESMIIEDTPEEELKKLIDELKRRIRALGTIYPGAAEEYEKLVSRYEFMLSQREDIEDAKISLRNIIDELTQMMKTVFKEKFEEINQMFGETFAEIFGGGKACVELTDPDDVLTSGIEIKVSPPGKSLRVISLLSGGEKAFVAIALYFAIMKVRPAPFCVLDEIEAALDDVNVVRYAKYLRKLCDTTQFIVITHRRGTMEEADVLYGVAMPTQGISKLLTLNINEAVKELGL
ncbi:MAG: chromosome segregation protein SMC [Clostridiales bacterium]|nr:chromosome segregation protein SMC [Clostridiales bacterium]